MNIHTAHHHYDLNGRDTVIEGYIEASLNFAYSHLKRHVWSMLDVGADYGYAMHYAEDSLECSRAVGIEPYLKHNPWGLDIRRISAEDPRLRLEVEGEFDLIFLNHTLEHFYNPTLVLSNLEHVRSAETKLFVAVPHANSEWSKWEGHFSIWTSDWLDHFCRTNGWRCVELVERELRPGCVEVWGVFE
jgi:hypothetical protein